MIPSQSNYTLLHCFVLISVADQLTRIFPVPSYARLLNFDHQVYRIPTSFSSKDHCSLMEVTELGRRLIYIGNDMRISNVIIN